MKKKKKKKKKRKNAPPHPLGGMWKKRNLGTTTPGEIAWDDT